MTMIPEFNKSNNFSIFDLIIRTSDLSYRVSRWHGIVESESENIGGNKIFENAERKNNYSAEIFGRGKSSIWNHKYSNSIHVYPDHIK